MPMHHTLPDFWARDRGLAWVLTLLAIAIFVILPLFHRLDIAILIFTVLFAAIMLSIIHAMGMTGWLRLSGWALALACVLSHIAAFFLAWPWLGGVELALNTIALCFLDGILLYRVFGPGAINANRIMGAVAVYLVAGLFFANFYELADILHPGSLAEAGQTQPMVKGAFVYFSFVTLTTAGYGDIVAVSPLARSLATAEALVGQLYPAVFIGGLISLSSTRKAE